jgi:transposase, IS30 family
MQRLTSGQRYQIQVYLESELTFREIARRLNVNVSTISREVKRVGRPYCPIKACEASLARASGRRSGKFKVAGPIKDYVDRRIREDWSPEQTCNKLKEETKQTLSVQTVYSYVRRDKQNRGTLYEHLRILRKQRKDRTSPVWKPVWTNISRRTDISERPAVVAERSRIGDYERDLVLGKLNGPALLTIVDRKSKKLWIKLIPKKCAEDVGWATVEALKGEAVHTITNDNGSEFANHYFTAKELGCKIYFSRAYRSWERGINENTNGLIRQYFPKKTSLADVTPERVKEVEDILNDRPRKTLGYKTPREVHANG